MEGADSPSSPAVGEGIGAQEQARLLGRYGRRFVAGDTLFKEGTSAHEAFLLQEGRVRLFKRVGIADHGVAIIKPGDLFGEGTSIVVMSIKEGSLDRARQLYAGAGIEFSVIGRVTGEPRLKISPSIMDEEIGELLRIYEEAIPRRLKGGG